MKTAADWTQEGHMHLSNHQLGQAIECYNNALSIDPQCEAREHREMAMRILEFGNRQIYNV